MSVLFPFLCLSAFLSSHRADANSFPCQPAVNRYNDFSTRYLSPDAPTSLDYASWEAHLKDTTDCSCSLQSFLSPADKRKVEDICSSAAGKQHRGNYCISNNQFTLISVRSELGTCIVRNVARVTQHIIVACDKVGNVCVPTHLEENWQGCMPRRDNAPCASPPPQKDGVFVVRAAGWMCLIICLLPIALCYFLA